MSLVPPKIRKLYNYRGKPWPAVPKLVAKYCQNVSYWYLSASPELLKLATQRWERRQGGAPR